MKQINIHQDYTLWLIMNQLDAQLSIVCAYMQNTTPYGDEYEKAFDKISKVRKELAELENDRQECVEARGK